VSEPATTARRTDGGHDAPACNSALVRAFEFLGKRWSGAVSYSLTPAGEALVPALHALADWAVHHLPAHRCTGR
jgi:hypothetical protein